MSNMHNEVPTGLAHVYHLHSIGGGGRVVRWCWVNFQCPGSLDDSRARAYCACSRCEWGGGGGGVGHLYSPTSFLSSYSLCLGDGPI